MFTSEEEHFLEAQQVFTDAMIIGRYLLNVSWVPSTKSGSATGAAPASPLHTHHVHAASRTSTHQNLHLSLKASSDFWNLLCWRPGQARMSRNQHRHTHTSHLQSMSAGMWWINTPLLLLLRQDNSEVYVLPHFPKFPSGIVPQMPTVVTGLITTLC